ncbi:MAG: hypothetical protein LBM18_06385 [Oscillospiraceae bacterium]|jgi:hypothetical protein|nr:hypothetical protein [Oscillospiraceae bacterium]
MNGFTRRVEIFLRRHPNFGVKNLMLYLIIGNVICYVIALMDTTGLFLGALTFDARAVFTLGQVWRLFTFVIVPPFTGIGNILWLAIALYFYYSIGNSLESAWGKGKFTLYYLFGMLSALAFGLIVWLITGSSMMLTASYINLSMFFAFATLYPDATFLLFFIIPVKAKWLAWVDAAFFALEIITGMRYFPANLLPLVAIANYLLFCGGWLFNRMRPKNIKAAQQQRNRTIEYRTAARQYHQQQAFKKYTRKCEVCGRTDADYPNLEFRFCSKCGGYHCFCMDHINNHTHFSE